MAWNRAKRLIVPLVAAHVLLNAVAASLLHTVLPDNLSLHNIAFYSLFMLGLSQGALLAVWVVFGGGRFPWRWLVTAFGVVVYAWCFFLVYGLNGVREEWMKNSLETMGVTAAALLLIRVAGLRLVRTSAPTTRGPFQFSIRDLLLWTTAVAVILGMWRCMPKAIHAYFVWDMPPVIPAGLVLITGAAMFSALGQRWFIARIALVPTVVTFAAVLFNRFVPSDASVTYHLVAIGPMMFWLITSLLVLRHAGYQLTWRTWRRKSQEDTVA